MIIRARLAIPTPGTVVEDAVVRIDGVRIAEVSRYSEFRASGGKVDRDLGDVLLLPGLINAHCHLDYTMLRGALLGTHSFTRWVQRLNAVRSCLTLEEITESVEQGFQQLARFGITTVLNIESYPEVLNHILAPPIRTFWFYELIDIRRKNPSEEMVSGALRFFEQNPGWLGGCGLSPHAPYTATQEMYALAAEAAAGTGMGLSTHLGESSEERQMFEERTGPLHEFMKELGRNNLDCGPGKPSPLRRLAENGVLGPHWIVAHLNEIAPQDWALLEPGGLLHGMTVVHCPQSHEFFGHKRFSMERLLACGANVCLGTDSLASGRELSLFREMALAHGYFPKLSPDHLLEMVTLAPAKALGMAGLIGIIRPGAYADLTAVRYSGPKNKASEAVLTPFRHAAFTMCHGQIVFESQSED